tara:strand:+ start:248 stop:607 length:360 start_codon:yes stop_codon:yes gene_type:complete
MRIMALLTMVTISVVAIFGSLALKSWSADLEAKDEQAFTKHIKHKLNPILWETHFAHKLELNQITSQILKIDINRVPDYEIARLLTVFQQLKYVRVHKLDITGDRRGQVFNISSVMTTD